LVGASSEPGAFSTSEVPGEEAEKAEKKAARK